ncbi:MAG: ATP-binding protein [Bdellovibrionales bacterium]
MRSARKSKRSLRSALMFSYLLFSIAPLAFITAYSLAIYQGAINDELKKRLDGNAREISVIITEWEQHLLSYGRIHASEPSLIYDLSTSSTSRSKTLLEGWLRTYIANRISVFDDEGALVISSTRVGPGKVQTVASSSDQEVLLNTNILSTLKNKDQMSVRDPRPSENLELVVYTKIMNKKGGVAGYLEELIVIDQNFLSNLKNRLKLEVILLNEQGQVSVSSQKDFSLYSQSFFQERMDQEKIGFFDHTIRDEPYGFIIRPLQSSGGKILIALGASKKDSQQVLRRIAVAMFSVSGVLILLLFPTLFWISRMILKPLDQLVSAAQKIESGEAVQKIPIESTSEISVLTDAFNNMSHKVSQARKELTNKIAELELTNKELQETQAQLVHSSKMVSLGQLVAGIAHELNNPIGFIYSNMAHLKEYSDKLVSLIETAEKHPENLLSEKKKAEFDYIIEDLPRLIKSCEDGARRTRDIVIGLRNFSRLDEAQIKEMDITESIKNTLDLLTGELKNRIDVKTDFQKLPLVKCYVSQINQVFMNILTNAAQAVEGKGTIWIKTSQEADQIQVSVRDSGQGISEKNLEKIFDPFFTTKPVGQGTGLGLSISFGIVKKHGGDITVESAPGKGTEFVICLPINPHLEEIAAV